MAPNELKRQDYVFCDIRIYTDVGLTQSLQTLLKLILQITK
jgi:hypothetical protein